MRFKFKGAKMKVIFISGPYRGYGIWPLSWVRRQTNIRRARKVALKYWEKGYVVICPHLNTMNFDGICEDEIWLRGDIEILNRCDEIVMMKNWKKSVGAIQEYKTAIQQGIFIRMDR